MEKVRVRFAPSPTGYLHVGSLRTALYNFLFARKHGGDFLLRIEDTDRSRYVEGAVENLITVLEKVGINWDEGVYLQTEIKDDKTQVTGSKNYPGAIEAGDHGPYIQSERLEIYKQYADQLVKDGKAYYCFCTSERLENLRKDQAEKKQAPMYDRYCMNLQQKNVEESLAEGKPCVIRMKIPKGEILEFNDLVRGKVSFSADTIDDQILIKSDGFPTYHLASVVDDHLMEISHVIRAEEWLPSTPKHILLYRAFGWDTPEFAHLPLLLNPDKSKLSKRQGDVAVEDYLKNGYLTEALINFVALLGWNPGDGSTKEIFSMEELIQEFDLRRVHKAGAVFDLKKLDWINSQYIKKLPDERFYAEAIGFLEQKEFYKSWNANNSWSLEEKEEYVKKFLSIEKERLSKFSEIGEGGRFFFKDIDYDKSLLIWKDMTEEDVKKSLEKAIKVLEKIEHWTKEDIERILLFEAGEKRGEFLWPLRVSLTGEQKSPSPFEVAWVLGREKSLERVRSAIGKL